MPDLTVPELQTHLAQQLSTLQDYVELESPTDRKAELDLLGSRIAEDMRQIGGEVTRIQQSEVGDQMLGRWGGAKGGILLMAHIDTVHPLGTIESMPWRVENGKAHGPGVLDMKSSVVMATTAIAALQENGGLGGRRVTLMITTDEETGSYHSRQLILNEAEQHELVLCLEPGLPNGEVKTWRKGIGLFEIRTTGRAAHAGSNPGKGINAIHEMAAHIPAIAALKNEEAGTSINIDIISGGTRTNVIAAACRADIDVRVLTDAEQNRLETAFKSVKPVMDGALVEIQGEWNRPPMERSAVIQSTFLRAKEIASQIDLELDEGGTGGGSDANFVAQLEIPLLDGLGPIGGGAHSADEYILVDSLSARSALLAGLIQDW